PISAKSTSNRTAAGPDCAPLPARPSTRSAAPSALPYRPSSRRCRPSPEPRLWCLKRQMARKPLIINVVQIETAEVGLKVVGNFVRLNQCANTTGYSTEELTPMLRACATVSRVYDF